MKCVLGNVIQAQAGQQYTSLKASFNYRCIAIRDGKRLEALIKFISSAKVNAT